MNIDISLLENKKPITFHETMQFKVTEEKEKENDVKTKVVVFDNEILQNYLTVSDLIKSSSLSNDKENYNIITNYHFVSVQMKDNRKVVLSSNKREKYIMLFFKNWEKVTIDFNTFVFEYLVSPKLLFHHLLSSYKMTLERFLSLERLGLWCLNFSSASLYFDKETWQPMLQCVQDCFVMSQKTTTTNKGYEGGHEEQDKVEEEDSFREVERSILNALRKVENYTFIPVELHLVVYLMNEIQAKSRKVLSILDVDKVSSDFVDKVSISYSHTSRIACYENCVMTLKKYLNAPKKEIISDILKNYKTWHNYSISILFLFLFQNLVQAFSLQDTLINEIVSLLFQNISPNVFQRDPSISQTLMRLKQIMDRDDWQFINELCHSDVTKFHELITA